MLSSISWTTFLTVLAVATALYYIAIGAVYYPKEILTFILGRRNRIKAQQVQEEEAKLDVLSKDGTFRQSVQVAPNFLVVAEKDNADGGDACSAEMVDDLTESINTICKSTRADSGDQKTLMASLQSLLAEYPQISKSHYRHSVNAFIQRTAMTYAYDVFISEADGLWPTGR